jgi:hypothetical protein
MVKDIWPGPLASTHTSVPAVDNTLFLSATDQSRLWKSVRCIQVLLRECGPGNDGCGPEIDQGSSGVSGGRLEEQTGHGGRVGPCRAAGCCARTRRPRYRGNFSREMPRCGRSQLRNSVHRMTTSPVRWVIPKADGLSLTSVPRHGGPFSRRRRPGRLFSDRLAVAVVARRDIDLVAHHPRETDDLKAFRNHAGAAYAHIAVQAHGEGAEGANQ